MTRGGEPKRLGEIMVERAKYWCDVAEMRDIQRKETEAMKARRRTVDRATIEWANGSHLERIDRMRSLLAKIDADPERTYRLAVCLCPMCHYEPSRIGGATTTSVQCAFCDTTLRYGNTAVGVCCMACATKAGVCRDCGADLDWKNRRKRTLPERTPTTDNN